MARTNDAPQREDLLAASADKQGLKDVLSTVVQDALPELIVPEVPARLGPRRQEWTGKRSQTDTVPPSWTASTPAGDVEVRITKP